MATLSSILAWEIPWTEEPGGYKRIYRIRTYEDADAIRMEMADRFGELPKQVERLLRVAELKNLAHACGMTEVKYQDGEVFYLIKNGTRVDAEQIPAFLKKRKGMRLVVAKKSGFAIRRSKLIQEEWAKEDDDSSVRFGFVIVDPDLRGSGNGKKMLKLGVAYAKEVLGASRVDLGVFENNEAARHCYEAVGFKEFSRRTCEMPIGTWTCIDMEMFPG